jgi:hypothetical protein
MSSRILFTDTLCSIPEMAMGWGSTLMQNETSFLVLDGAYVYWSSWAL